MLVIGYLAIIFFEINITLASKFSAQLTKIWGPGLQPEVFVLPARYFFIQAVDTNNNRYVFYIRIKKNASVNSNVF